MRFRNGFKGDTRARERLATDTSGITRKYKKNVTNATQLEITPSRYPALASAMERVRALAIRGSAQILEHERSTVIDMATRPAAFILRDQTLCTDVTSPPDSNAAKTEG